MSERTEWELVPLVREDRRALVEELAEEILSLDAILEVAPERMTEDQQARLIQLQREMAECVVSPCEAADAPLLSTRPDWTSEVRTAFENMPSNDGLCLREFVEMMDVQHDCSRCEGASLFPGVSGIPCEFDLTPLFEILTRDTLLEQVQFEMEPDEMRLLADDLDRRLLCKAFCQLTDFDTESYLSDAVRFLRYWAHLGYGVAPAYVRTE